MNLRGLNLERETLSQFLCEDIFGRASNIQKQTHVKMQLWNI